MSEANEHWMWVSDDYDTTSMTYQRKGTADEFSNWIWMGSVKFSTLNRNYKAHSWHAEPQEFLHKKDAKAWVEVTAKLGHAAS